MATYSRILAWRIPRTEESGGATVRGIRESREDGATLHTHMHIHTPCNVPSFLGPSHLNWDTLS